MKKYTLKFGISGGVIMMLYFLLKTFIFPVCEVANVCPPLSQRLAAFFPVTVVLLPTLLFYFVVGLIFGVIVGWLYGKIKIRNLH
mgnify:CR=1 FL=1